MYDQSLKMRLGDSARVCGKIHLFEDAREISVTSVAVEEDVNAEALHLLLCVKNYRTIYSKPFPLPPIDQITVTPLPSLSPQDDSIPNFAFYRTSGGLRPR